MTEFQNPSRRGLLAAGLTTGALAAAPAFAQAPKAAGAVTLLNVSYDPTRELYREINAAFAVNWKQRTGQTVTINQSHGGSGRQARSVIDGLQADVVTLALAGDIDEIANKAGLLAKTWQTRLPQNSTPYTSTIVLLVRKGNPWKIRDWGDLVRPGIKVITPNPKTSGGARWNHLAAYDWALRQPNATTATAQAYLRALYKNVPVLDTGARASTLTFAQRGIGDVFLSWENEAHLAGAEFGNRFDIVYPSRSILAEPPVALVDRVVDRRKTRPVAQAYLEFLYTEQAQDIIGKNFYRPRSQTAAAKYASRFPRLNLSTINDPAFGGWAKAQRDHFNDGGVFDRVTRPA